MQKHVVASFNIVTSTVLAPNAQARIWAFYPCLKTRSRMFTRARKWSLVPCVHTVFISVLGQSTAKLMFQNGVRQGEME